MANTKPKAAPLDSFEAPAIERRIFVIRDRQVMLDEDLAELYGVETKVLGSRSKEKEGRGGRRYLHFFFHRARCRNALGGSAERKRAIAVNIEIMRTFVELRRIAELIRRDSRFSPRFTG